MTHTSDTDSAKLRTPSEAVACVRPGNRLAVGGFGLVGTPAILLEALCRSEGARDLTVISNNLGSPGAGLGALLRAGAIRKAIGSYFTTNREALDRHHAGELELELIPQGTLAEALRAAGAGLGGVLTKTGVGTELQADKQTLELSGQRYLVEPALHADVGFVKAATADTLGNLIYSKTARNFNPDVACSASVVVAEVDEIVPVGELSPEAIVTPHPFVTYLVCTRGRS